LSCPHNINGVSFVVFEQGIDDQGKHGHLFFAKARGEIFQHYFVKKLSGAFFLKAFGFNFKIAIGKYFAL
jgi:hypothetical protein